jgi:outer membrane receptor protein involved in Fe transport
VTPKFKATATARYSWPVFADAKAHVQAAVAYQSSAPASLRTLTALSGVGLDCTTILGFASCNPNLWLGKIRGAALFDVFTGLDWPKYSLELYATNLFDKRNDLSRGVNCGSCTRTLIVPGRPRTIGIRAGIKF